MQPSQTDLFDPADIAHTFTILDGVPGVTPIANYAALPTNLTSAQHGSKYLQLDNGAEWYWYQPSSGSGGVWKRSNSIGQLGASNFPSNYSLSWPGPLYASPTPTLATVSGTASGNRWLAITAWVTNMVISTDAIFILYQGATEVSRLYWTYDGTGLSGASAMYYWAPPMAPGASFTFSLGALFVISDSSAAISMTYNDLSLTVTES
jgi:hypothetical protein